MRKNQKGFGVIEALLLLILLAVVAGIFVYISHNKKTPVTTDSSGNSSAQKTLLVDFVSSKTTAFNWDLKIYSDGSGSTEFSNAPGNTRPVPENKTFPTRTFDTISLRQQLDTLNPATYQSSCDQSDNFSVTYKGHSYSDIECYIGVTSNHAAGLGSQTSKVFDKAGL